MKSEVIAMKSQLTEIKSQVIGAGRRKSVNRIQKEHSKQQLFFWKALLSERFSTNKPLL